VPSDFATYLEGAEPLRTGNLADTAHDTTVKVVHPCPLLRSCYWLWRILFNDMKDNKTQKRANLIFEFEA
jgi:hypothetical protein